MACSLARLLEVSNPKLVVILGCFGLASNIVGLFLFHGMSFSLYCLSQEQSSPRYESLSTLDLENSLIELSGDRTAETPYVSSPTVQNPLPCAFQTASLTRRSQITEIPMGIPMGMVTMITNIHYRASTRRNLLHTKPLKLSHYSSTRLLRSVHLMEPNVVLVLALLRSLHASAIPCRPVQPWSQLHNPWLPPHQLTSPLLLTGDHHRLPAAAQPALNLGATRFTLPLEIWTTSQRSTVVLLPPMLGEGPYHPTSIPMGMDMIMTTAITLLSMPIP